MSLNNLKKILLLVMLRRKRKQKEKAKKSRKCWVRDICEKRNTWVNFPIYCQIYSPETENFILDNLE